MREVGFTEERVRELIDYEAFCGASAVATTVAGEASPADTASVSAAAGDITVHELSARFERGETPFVLDVREPHEWEICHLRGAKHIPLRELGKRVDEVPRDRVVVVYCKLGGRSAQAAVLLRQAGRQRVMSLQGGIRAWSENVDATMPTY